MKKAAAIALFQMSLAFAAEKPVQPYIDQLKETMPDKGKPAAASGSYTESLKKDLPPVEQESYIDQLKQANPALTPPPSSSYLEQEKAKLAPKPPGESAIAKTLKGESELEPRKLGEIRGAFGARIGAGLSHVVSNSSAAGRSFDALYSGKKPTDVSLFYEFQPFHSEWFGNIGILVGAGLTYHSGTGTFDFADKLTRPQANGAVGATLFDANSRTQFQFFTLPAMVGVDYRFNLFRIVRPYVMFAPTLIGFLEMRNDDRGTHRGFSKGLFFSGGVSVLLDPLMPDSSWDLYMEHGVKHYYLTIDYSRLTSLASVVQFTYSGISAGFTYEF